MAHWALLRVGSMKAIKKLLRKQKKLLVHKMAKRALDNLIATDWGNDSIYKQYPKAKQNRWDKIIDD